MGKREVYEIPPETERQLNAIRVITDVLNIEYVGDNIEDATEFITRNMSESKKVAEERKQQQFDKKSDSYKKAVSSDYETKECPLCKLFQDLYPEMMYQIDILELNASRKLSKKASNIYSLVINDVRDVFLKYAKPIAAIRGIDWNYDKT